MTEELKRHLIELADKYENTSFPDSDPSQFLRWFDIKNDGVTAVECASFIAAMLAFGNRKQFIPKIKQILQMSQEMPTDPALSKGQVFIEWLKSNSPNFDTGKKKFYRFYSYDDMRDLFSELGEIVTKYASLGEAVRHQLDFLNCNLSEKKSFNVADALSSLFPKSAIVPKGRSSANKRIHMYLRWMVRMNSPVDLGLWEWANPAELLIPLDVHVMQEAVKLGLLPPGVNASRKTAEKLTEKLRIAFPKDPCRADYSLFGLGVDEKV